LYAGWDTRELTLAARGLLYTGTHTTIITPMATDTPAMSSGDQPQSDAARPRRITRRKLLLAAGGMVAGTAGLGVYARWIEPTWLHVVRADVPVANLPPEWDGVRVALVADLHHWRKVPIEYLAWALGRVQSLGADMIVAAGDFILGLDPADGQRVAALFRNLSAPLGVFACLGNHDYGIAGPVLHPPARPLPVAGALRAAGVRVLENEAAAVDRGGSRVWLAGVGDYWSGNFRPREARKDVPAGAATIVMCHNPDAAEAVDVAGDATILSGHTHGGQVQIPLLGPPVLPVANHDRYEGLHRVGGSWVYITRGVGWTYRIRFNCRPEISLLVLRREVRQA